MRECHENSLIQLPQITNSQKDALVKVLLRYLVGRILTLKVGGIIDEAPLFVLFNNAPHATLRLYVRLCINTRDVTRMI